MKKIAIFLMIALVALAFLAVPAAAETYDDGVVSIEIPYGFQKSNSMSEALGQMWLSDNYGMIIIAYEDNTSHASLIHASDEAKQQLVKNFERGFLLGSNLSGGSGVDVDMPDSVVEDATVNGYQGVKITNTIHLSESGGTGADEHVECYMFATEKHIIQVSAVGFSGLYFTNDFQKARAALDSLKIYEPLLQSDSGKEKDGLSTGTSILLRGLGTGAIGGLIGLAIGLMRKKKKEAAQAAEQAPVYSAPVNAQTPQQYGVPMNAQVPTQYGAPMNTQAPTQYGAPMNTQAPTQYGVPVNTQAPTQYGVQVSTQAPTQYGVPMNQQGPTQYGAPMSYPTMSIPQNGAAPNYMTGDDVFDNTKGE